MTPEKPSTRSCSRSIDRRVRLDGSGWCVAHSANGGLYSLFVGDRNKETVAEKLICIDRSSTSSASVAVRMQAGYFRLLQITRKGWLR